MPAGEAAAGAFLRRGYPQFASLFAERRGRASPAGIHAVAAGLTLPGMAERIVDRAVSTSTLV